MAEVSKIITEKQDDPWNGEKPGQDTKKKKTEKPNIAYCRISKRLAVETSLYCSCSITSTHHCSKVRMPSLSLALRCMLITS